jgi:hypothetical protein
MFRWVSIIGSWTAIALLGATSFAGFIEAGWDCVGWVWDGPLPSKCVTLYSLALWPFFLGLGLTAFWALVHLFVAAQQKRWGWFNALLIAPPTCFCVSAFVGGPYSSNSFMFFILCLPFIGLPNLLFSLKVLWPGQAAVRVSSSGKELSGTCRWISIICSAIGAAMLGGMSVVVSLEEAWGCTNWDRIDPLPSVCFMLYTLGGWTSFLGIGLTALFGLIHLGVASQQHRWGWFNALLMVPFLCFFMGPYIETFADTDYSVLNYTDSIYYKVGLVLWIISLPLAGLPNLLFGIFSLKPKRRTARAALPGAEPAPVPPLSETHEQPQP